MPRPKRTSQNFNSRLLAALESGCKQEVRISLGSPKEAIRFRHEVNALRAALRDSGRAGWENYYEAGLYIDPKFPATVIIRPKAGDFKQALDAAGIPDLAEPPAPPPDTNVETSAQSIEDFMADLRKLR